MLPVRAAGLTLLAALGLSLLPAGPLPAEEPLFEHQVLPILTKHCMGCHGGLRQFGGLDLRTIPAMLAGGESGEAVVVGQSGQSELWRRIVTDDMPEGNDREKLSAEEKEIIKRWIDSGLPTVAQRRGKVDPLLSPGERHPPPVVAEAIDRHLERALAEARLTPAPPSDDQEFMRRLYLDLTGRVPTAEQALAFLQSEEPEKRARLIDELLDSPRFGTQFGRTWRDWVSPPELPSDNNGGRQPYQQADEFGRWLGEKFAAGEPWDKIVRDILLVKGEIKTQPQVIFYPLAGEGGKTAVDGSARAVASLFMGVQLQCAQCHDDPYRDWSQREFWALGAFFGRMEGDFGKIEIGKGPSKTPGEIVIPDSAFKNSGTAVTAAFPRSDQPAAIAGEDPRAPFTNWLTDRENPYFARSFANRAWFYLFGRGIVHPIDDFRELNPPSHPGLLQLLANEFRDSGFDVKHLFRCVCNSRAYQRTSAAGPEADPQLLGASTFAFGRMPLRLMTADMLHDSLKLAYGEEKEFDLRGGGRENTTGEAATLAGPYVEFHRKFGINEEDPADFTHGISQMLTLINHPRLLAGGKALENHLKQHPEATPDQVVAWLYLNTLSRPPDDEELAAAREFVQDSAEPAAGYRGVLWMLVNRSEFLLVR